MTQNLDEIMNLKALGDNQDQADRYMLEQERAFNRLVQDFKRDRLVKGIPKDNITARYGEPILCNPVNSQLDINEFFLYRHPAKYFGSEKVYLYFDKSGCLNSWIYEPAAE